MLITDREKEREIDARFLCFGTRCRLQRSAAKHVQKCKSARVFKPGWMGANT